MLYRIKDFQTVYNISENKFKYKDQEFDVKKTIDEVIEISRSEIKKKNIELTITHGDDVP
jgi:hypothetical protein